MAEVYKFPIPQGGKQIAFNINGKQKYASIFLFAKFSKRFRTVEMLKCEVYNVISNVSDESFDTFLSACQERPFLISSDNIYHLYLLSREFDTPSISKEVDEFYSNNDIETLIRDILLIKEPDENLRLINSAASRFNELIYSKSLLDADPEIMKIILESQDFSKVNHSNLFNFAKEYQIECNKKNKDSSFIFKYIDLNQLSTKEIYEYASLEKFSEELLSKNVMPIIKKFCESLQEQENLIDKFNETAQNLSEKIEETEKKLTESNELRKKLIEKNEEYEKRYKKCVEIQEQNANLLEEIKQNNYFQGEKEPLHGIFYYFKKNSYLNDYKDDLEILTPKQPNMEFPVSNLLEFSPNFLPLSYYLKVDKAEDNWIIFHLKKHKICLTGFTIRTNELGSTIAHPKKFQILASNDDVSYDKLYEFEDKEQKLYKVGKTEFFSIQSNNEKKFYTYIKYRQISGHHPYYDNDRIIALSAFEIFGTLLPN